MQRTQELSLVIMVKVARLTSVGLCSRVKVTVGCRSFLQSHVSCFSSMAPAAAS